MRMLREDDLNLKDMTAEELAAAWDLWFTLARATNDSDPPYTHGVFVNLTWSDLRGDDVRGPEDEAEEAPREAPE